MLGRIKAERDHERAGREGTNGSCRDVECGEIAVIPGAERQRNVEVGAEPCALAALIGVAPNMRIVEGRIGVDGNGEDAAPFIEDALRAVAVVDVDVEDRDALVFQPQIRGTRRPRCSARSGTRYRRCATASIETSSAAVASRTKTCR
jgi:hypothetical protein